MGHREAPCVGLSPIGQSMGYSASTCKSQPHSMIYGAQWAHLWVSAPQVHLWGTVGLLVGLSPTGRGGGRGAVGRSPTRVGRSCGAGGDPRGGRYRMGSRSTLGAPHGFRPITPREPHTTAGRRSHGRSTEIRRHLWGGDGGQTHMDPQGPHRDPLEPIETHRDPLEPIETHRDP